MIRYDTLDAADRSRKQLNRLLALLETIPKFPELEEVDPGEENDGEHLLAWLRHRNEPSDPELADDDYFWGISLMLGTLYDDKREHQVYLYRALRVELMREDTFLTRNPGLKIRMDYDGSADSWSVFVWRAEEDEDEEDGEKIQLTSEELALVQRLVPGWNEGIEQPIAIEPHLVEANLRAMFGFHLEHLREE